MSASEARARLRDGSFMDGIVAPAIHSLVCQLKAEYQKEMGVALQAASESSLTVTTAGLPEDILTSEGIRSPLPFTRGDLRPPVELFEERKREDSLPSKAFTDKPWATQPRGGGAAAEVEDIQETNLPHSVNFPSQLRSAAKSPQVWSQCRFGASSSSSPFGSPDADTKEDGQSVNSPNASFRFPQDGLCTRLPERLQLAQEDEKIIADMRAEQEALQKAAQRRAAGLNSYRMSMMFTEENVAVTRRTAISIAASPYFDFLMGFIIVANALTIGVETSSSRQQIGIPLWLQACEYVFLVIYIMELWLRAYALGLRRAFANHWVKFDALLVASGVLNVLLSITSVPGDGATQIVDNVNMLKMIRLVRLARTVRVLVQFRTLWLLVQGLMYAVMPMLWTSLIMLGVIYVFAVVGMEMIVSSTMDDEYAQAAMNFDTIWTSMITLMQFMTLDSVATIYRPIITVTPALALYFLTFLLLGPIALMNIVTAIMVESSLRTANEDQEAKRAWENMKRKAMMPKLRNIFLSIDADGDEEVDLQELLSAPDDVKDQIRRIVDLDKLEEIFHLLDYDGSGSISIDEFVDGVMRSQADKPSELILLVKQGKAILERLRK